MTNAITTNVAQLRRGGVRTLGSVEGTLDALNLHGRPSFTIWDRVTRRPVRCWFPNTPEWKAKVKGLLEKRVLVSGRVQYYSKAGPYTVDELRDIRDTTPDPSWPRASFGSIPLLTGNQETME